MSRSAVRPLGGGGRPEAPAPAPGRRRDEPVAEAALHLAALTAPTSYFEHKLITDAARAVAAEPAGPADGACSVGRVALRLRAQGYAVAVRRVTACGREYWARGAAGGAFLTVLDAQGGGGEYVVDPSFPELFAVAYTSERYGALLAALPRVFVGLPCQLLPCVQLVCAEMEESFRSSGRPLPPWRALSATLARWTGDAFVEVDVPLLPGGGGAEEEAARARFLEACGPAASLPCSPAAAGSGGGGGGGASGGGAAAGAARAPGPAASIAGRLPYAAGGSAAASGSGGGGGPACALTVAAPAAAQARPHTSLLTSKMAEVRRLESALDGWRLHHAGTPGVGVVPLRGAPPPSAAAGGAGPRP